MVKLTKEFVARLCFWTRTDSEQLCACDTCGAHWPTLHQDDDPWHVPALIVDDPCLTQHGEWPEDGPGVW